MNELNKYQERLDNAKTHQDLYSIAGSLNNRDEHVLVDKVTFLGMCDFEYAKQQVQFMLNQSKKLIK